MNGLTELLRDVEKFHVACDVPVLRETSVPAPERVALRRDLIDEEVNKELLPAMDAGDLPAIADALADSIYVLVGTALEYGLPLDRVWAAVQNANMRKVDPETGKVVRREDGKILKPEGWTPPPVAEILFKPHTPGPRFTRSDPEKYDYFYRLAPDEPHFLLMGRDLDSSIVVHMWAIMRNRQIAIGMREDTPEERRQISDALICAHELNVYADSVKLKKLRQRTTYDHEGWPLTIDGYLIARREQ